MSSSHICHHDPGSGPQVLLGTEIGGGLLATREVALLPGAPPKGEGRSICPSRNMLVLGLFRMANRSRYASTTLRRGV